MPATHPSVEADYVSRKLILENPNNRLALSAIIDHTLLKIDAQEAQIQSLLKEANLYHFKSICVSGSALEIAHRQSESNNNGQSRPLLCTVVGFPHGHSSTKSKTCEISSALENGADEFDYVQNIGWVKDGYWNKLTAESEQITQAAQGKVVKVILETALLNDEEIYNSALAAARGGVHILKTSTGFSHRGVVQNDVEILRRVTEDFEKISNVRLGIKASGGIKSLSEALSLIQLGATRLGTSSGIFIVNGLSVTTPDVY